MTTGYTSYTIEVTDTLFTAGDGRTFKKSAKIIFYDQKGEEVGTEIFGAVESDYVYDLIKEGKKINLDNCYVSEFSLSTYRRENSLEKKSLVPIVDFSARNSFFEAKTATDFSFSSFSAGDINFKGSHFAKGRVLFNGSVFRPGNVIFSETFFRDGNIEFTGAVFGDGDFLFKNAVTGDGIKDFQDIQFGNGEVNFANTEFNNGELLFINTKFNSGSFNFKVTRITSGKVDFHYSVFNDCDIMFERTEFGNSRIDFRTGPGAAAARTSRASCSAMPAAGDSGRARTCPPPGTPAPWRCTAATVRR
jgi:hypothetical protein